KCDWSSDVCASDLHLIQEHVHLAARGGGVKGGRELNTLNISEQRVTDNMHARGVFVRQTGFMAVSLCVCVCVCWAVCAHTETHTHTPTHTHTDLETHMPTRVAAHSHTHRKTHAHIHPHFRAPL